MGKISNYASALKAKLTDFFVIVSDNNGVLETKKVTTEQIGDAVASDQVHSSLNTSDKTLTGAINENVSSIGTLSSLTTTDKSSLVGAVNEVNSDISNRQAYTYRVTNVGSNITIRMRTTSTGEFLYHIVGSVSNGQTFYDSIITGSVSGGAVYCKNIGQNQLGTPIITNNVIKFTVANWSQLLITGLSPVSEITATPT